jgi:hypothetical protein
MPVHLEPLSSDIGTDNLLGLHPKTVHGWQDEANRFPGRQVFTNSRQTNLKPRSAFEPNIGRNSPGFGDQLATSGCNCV